MKTIINILLAVGALHLLGCKEKVIGEPHQLGAYFSFVTVEGGDFFESDERYDAGKVTFSCRPVDYVFTLGGVNIFETSNRSCESIIGFGNGDQDTLKVEWFPSIYGDGTSSASELDRVIYTYNGIVVDTWTFDSDLQFFYELVRRNSTGNEESRNSNPIVIKLPKTADEDELN